jgi:hypothetical protein
LDEVWFPAELNVGIEQVERSGDTVTIWIGATKKSAVCPGCGQESDRVHSIYQRKPKDLPLVGYAVWLRTRVRRFFCDNDACGWQTFAERFPGLLAVKAQRTERLMAHHQAIALALGGEAGRQVCRVLGMPISGDTLIRAIRQSAEPAIVTPRVLGLDD